MKLAKWVTTVVVSVTLSAVAGVSGRSQTASPSAPKALSRVTRLDITSRLPAFGGKSFGTAGPYEILIGRAHMPSPTPKPRRMPASLTSTKRPAMPRGWSNTVSTFRS